MASRRCAARARWCWSEWVPTKWLPIPVTQTRELTVTGVFRYTDTWPVAIGLVASGQVDLDALVTAHFPLEAAEDALTSDTAPGSLKSVVLP